MWLIQVVSDLDPLNKRSDVWSLSLAYGENLVERGQLFNNVQYFE